MDLSLAYGKVNLAFVKYSSTRTTDSYTYSSTQSTGYSSTLKLTRVLVRVGLGLCSPKGWAYEVCYRALRRLCIEIEIEK